MNNSRVLRIVLYATLIFVAGAITGALVAPHVGRHFMRPPRPEEMSRHMLEHLRSELNLTESQAAKIEPLIRETGRELDQLRRDTTQRVRARLAESNAQISRLLTPEQQIRFEKMETEHRRHLRHRHGRGDEPATTPAP